MEKIISFEEMERLKEKYLENKEDCIEKIVDLIIKQGIIKKASDIHILPYRKKVIVKYRIDGVLYPVLEIPSELHEGIIVKIKVMSDLPVYKKDIPQDGNIVVENENIEIRATFFPTCWGEKVVMRILDYGSFGFNLEKLGFSENILRNYKEIIKKSSGVILLTGPANSGKTTTIYSTLQEKLKENPDLNIITLEDPIEFKFENITQTQIDRNITYSKGLRSILRQDPDIIVVGEIRDSETAKVVMEAGLTGHLVFATIHAGTVADVLIRLIKMEIEPFLLSSAISGILAQRLVRKICENCKEKCDEEKELMGKFGISVSYKGKGCELCGWSGYRGRTVIGELIIPDNLIKNAILNKVPISKILNIFKEKKIKTLFEDGIEKVKKGITTLEEIKKVI